MVLKKMRFNIEEMVPVRDPVKQKKQGSYRIRFPSLKMNRTMSIESSLAWLYAKQAEVDHMVEAFCEEPYTFDIGTEGKTQRYTPDFIVRRNGKIFFVEVKPYKKSVKPDLKAKHERCKKYFARLGYGFFVLTERDLQRQPMLRNIDHILRYADETCTEGHQILLADRLGKKASMTLGALKKLTAENDNLPNPYSLIKGGLLRVDHSKLLDDEAVLEIMCG